MPRNARTDIPGLHQHVIIRGDGQADIFENDEDRHDFVWRLGALLAEIDTLCYAWVLLDSPVHLVLLPTKQTLASLMRRLLTGYAVSCYLVTRRMLLPEADIATSRACTDSAVSKASHRGEKLIQEDTELRAFIEFVVLSRMSR
jgi:hypothetical protein